MSAPIADAVLEPAGLASFEHKWAASHPELVIAAPFVSPPLRDARVALACIGWELAEAALGSAGADPAFAKLAWWAEELTRAPGGDRRHPLTRALAEHPRLAALDPSPWRAAVGGAMALRDAGPAADAQSLLAGLDGLFRPLGVVQAALFGGDPDAIARRQAMAHLLRGIALLDQGSDTPGLPLPLDLLARHRLGRGALAEAGPARTALLRDWLADLAADPVARQSASDALDAAMAVADRWRLRQGLRGAEPVAALAAAIPRLPWWTALAAWRGGRRAGQIRTED